MNRRQILEFALVDSIKSVILIGRHEELQCIQKVESLRFEGGRLGKKDRRKKEDERMAKKRSKRAVEAAFGYDRSERGIERKKMKEQQN